MRSIACYRKKFSTIPRCDLDLLISFVIKQPIAKLYSDPDYLLSAQEETQLEKLLARYQQGEPIAYLIGHSNFWTMNLTVTRDTFIPRPETECLIQWIVDNIDKNKKHVADLGTGAGAIAIALALENPHWKIDATDLSLAALAVAKHNAKTYQIKNIDFYHGNWCDVLSGKNQYDLIVSNPPYIAENDPHLSQLIFEPKNALVSGKEGLDAIREIILQARWYLKNMSVLILEHGFDQASQVTALLQNAKYKNIKSHRDLSGHTRFVRACSISRGSSENW